MKKLIVFSVIFALLATAVFADLNIGGGVGGNVKVAVGDTVEGSHPVGSSGHETRIDFSGQNDDGTFGGYGRIFAYGGEDFWGVNFGQVWWKPLDFFKVTVGYNWWGDFGSNAIVRWDFYADASDNGVVNENYWGAGAVYGGFETEGVLLQFTPVDGLSINFALPYGDQKDLRNTWKFFMGQVQYWISGVGKVGITFEGSGLDGGMGTWYDGGGMHIWSDTPKIYADFFLTALENNGLQVSLGLGYKFQNSGPLLYTDWWTDYFANDNFVRNDQVNVALGVNFWAGDFGFKMRVFAGFGGGSTYEIKGGDTYTINDPFELKLDILPSYNLDGLFRFFFSAGITMTGKKQADVQENGKTVVKDVDESDTFGFHINPYIIKPISTGGTFYAGFRLQADNMINLGKDAQGNDNKVVMNWSIPLALSFGF